MSATSSARSTVSARTGAPPPVLGSRQGMTDGAPRVERDGAVVRITMTRAARRNALSREHLTQLLAAVTETGNSDATGIVLGGEGPVFSAGHDFADVAGASLPEVRSL